MRIRLLVTTPEGESMADDRLFAGIFPAGISWADTAKEENGDYKQVAFLSYGTLELTVYDARSPLLDRIKLDAAGYQARRGELLALSECGRDDLAKGIASGQTVRLGYGLKS